MIYYEIKGKQILPIIPKIIGHVGDNLSETVRFKMARFYDDTDMADGFPFIHTRNASGTRRQSALTIEVEDEFLHLVWHISHIHTELAGRLEFQISIQGENSVLWSSDMSAALIEESLASLEPDTEAEPEGEVEVAPMRSAQSMRMMALMSEPVEPTEPVNINEKSAVTLSGRTMSIPEASAKIGVRGDRNAETVTFLADRYYDGQDFSEKNWFVEVLNANNEYDICGANAILAENDKLSLEWMIGPRHTVKDGKVSVKLRATENDTFIWQSYTGVFTLAATFNEGEIQPEPGLSVADQVLQELRVAVSALAAAEGTAAECISAAQAAAANADSAAQIAAQKATEAGNAASTAVQAANVAAAAVEAANQKASEAATSASEADTAKRAAVAAQAAADTAAQAATQKASEAAASASEADTAKRAAVAAQAAAEAAKTAAEAAQATATQKAADAETARAAAVTAKTAAEAAQATAAQKAADAETARAAAVTAKTAAEAAQATATQKAADAETASAAAVAAKIAAEAAQAAAVAAKEATEAMKNDVTEVVAGLGAAAATITNLIDTDTGLIKEQYIPDTASNSAAYGARWSGASPTTLTRLGASVGLTAAFKIGSAPVANPFDGLSPWADIALCNLDNEGNVVAYEGEPRFAFDGVILPYAYKVPLMVRIKKFFYKVTTGIENEVRWWEWWVSGSHLPGYNVHEAFKYPDGSEADEVFIGAKLAGTETINGKVCLTSASGDWPYYNVGRQTFRANARNRGPGWEQADFFTWNALQLLYLVESADFNAQSVIGEGISSKRYSADDKALVAETGTNRIIIANAGANARYVGEAIMIGASLGSQSVCRDRFITAIDVYDDTSKAITFDGSPVNIALNNVIACSPRRAGDCDELGSYSGRSGQSTTNNRCQVSYRGVEGFWGNAFTNLDGVLIVDREWFFNLDPAKWNDSTANPADGWLSMGVCASSNGYISALLYNEHMPSAMIPAAAVGASNTFLCDYYWQNTGVRSPRAGGGASDGAICGPWSWRAYYTPGGGGWTLAGRLRYRRPQ